MPADDTETALSTGGVPIRLTAERWRHVTGGHPEVAGLRAAVLAAIREPERVLAGGDGERLAVRAQEDGKVLVAVYRELAEDGFVITAFLTRRLANLNRRTLLWPLPNPPNTAIT